MGVNLDELERLYKAATQGEWLLSDVDIPPIVYLGAQNNEAMIACVDAGAGYANLPVNEAEANAKSIAALHNAFPALLALARDGERYREMEQKLRDFADAEYVLGIDIATYSAACQGIEAKLASGTFGAKELKAHEKMNRHFGAHFGIHAAIDAARKGERP